MPLPCRFCFHVAVLFFVVTSVLPKAQATLPPRSGMAAPPVSVARDDPRFDPTWVSHRGQVVLFLYVGENSALPEETVRRINEWQAKWYSRGLLVVVMTEGEETPAGLSPDIVVVRDNRGKTRKDYRITDEREYFLVDRYGRLRRRKIRPSLVERALREYFDPGWVGFSTSWNQSYFVFGGETLLYLADTVPDTVSPGEAVDVRMIALPTFMEPRQGKAIHSPIQIEVWCDPGFEKEVYRAELNEEVEVSTELLIQVGLRKDAESGFHVLRIHVRHRHCGFGTCGGYEETIPVPVWVE